MRREIQRILPVVGVLLISVVWAPQVLAQATAGCG